MTETPEPLNGYLILKPMHRATSLYVPESLSDSDPLEVVKAPEDCGVVPGDRVTIDRLAAAGARTPGILSFEIHNTLHYVVHKDHLRLKLKRNP